MTKEQIIEAVKSMTVLELNDLVKAIEEEFGVTAAAPVAVAGGAGEAAAEKTEFDVELTSAGAQKSKLSKLFVKSLVLAKEAKELVDNTPKVIKRSCC
ncbi:50S ribosomal protein L7/L12 [Bacillus cereus]